MALQLIRAGTRLTMLCSVVDESGDTVREIPLETRVLACTEADFLRARQMLLEKYEELRAQIAAQIEAQSASASEPAAEAPAEAPAKPAAKHARK